MKVKKKKKKKFLHWTHPKWFEITMKQWIED